MTATTTTTTSATAAAPTAERRRAAHPSAQRAPLQVVPAGYRPPQARRRRARLITVSAIAIACVLVFGLAGIHVLLTEGQFRLAHLQTKANDAEAEYVRLRLEVAQLESPQRIVADAQERLGMISPSALTYLTPTSAVTVARHATMPAHTTTTTKRKTIATLGWATAKPALASHP